MAESDDIVAINKALTKRVEELSQAISIMSPKLNKCLDQLNQALDTTMDDLKIIAEFGIDDANLSPRAKRKHTVHFKEKSNQIVNITKDDNVVDVSHLKKDDTNETGLHCMAYRNISKNIGSDKEPNSHPQTEDANGTTCLCYPADKPISKNEIQNLNDPTITGTKDEFKGTGVQLPVETLISKNIGSDQDFDYQLPTKISQIFTESKISPTLHESDNTTASKTSTKKTKTKLSEKKQPNQNVTGSDSSPALPNSDKPSVNHLQEDKPISKNNQSKQSEKKQSNQNVTGSDISPALPNSDKLSVNHLQEDKPISIKRKTKLSEKKQSNQNVTGSDSSPALPNSDKPCVNHLQEDKPISENIQSKQSEKKQSNQNVTGSDISPVLANSDKLSVNHLQEDKPISIKTKTKLSEKKQTNQTNTGSDISPSLANSDKLSVNHLQEDKPISIKTKTKLSEKKQTNQTITGSDNSPALPNSDKPTVNDHQEDKLITGNTKSKLSEKKQTNQTVTGSDISPTHNTFKKKRLQKSSDELSLQSNISKSLEGDILEHLTKVHAREGLTSRPTVNVRHKVESPFSSTIKDFIATLEISNTSQSPSTSPSRPDCRKMHISPQELPIDLVNDTPARSETGAPIANAILEIPDSSHSLPILAALSDRASCTIEESPKVAMDLVNNQRGTESIGVPISKSALSESPSCVLPSDSADNSNAIHNLPASSCSYKVSTRSSNRFSNNPLINKHLKKTSDHYKLKSASINHSMPDIVTPLKGSFEEADREVQEELKEKKKSSKPSCRGTLVFNNNITLGKNVWSAGSEHPAPFPSNHIAQIIVNQRKSSTQPSGAPDTTYFIFAIKSKTFKVHCIEKNYFDFKNLIINVFVIFLTR
jgi:hypothetical protein